MRKVRVGINGLGRIGRQLLRILTLSEHKNLQLVAVNSPGAPEIYAQLIKYDSVHGPFSKNVFVEDGNLMVAEQKIRITRERDPSNIPWSDSNVDIVIDSTGKFKDNESLGKHLGGSVKKVVLCCPAKGEIDATLVMGVNHNSYRDETHHVVSNASCTTNCLAPVVNILNQFGKIESGFMSTVHAYTCDQSLLDSSHKDPRRARAASLSLIPTSTGATKSIGVILPELDGKLDGFSIRVPTPNVSMVDLTVILEKETSVDEINRLFANSCVEEYQDLLAYSDLPLVSVDYNGRPESGIFDATLTRVHGKMVKVIVWYDNESGYSNRVLDLASFIGEQSKWH